MWYIIYMLHCCAVCIVEKTQFSYNDFDIVFADKTPMVQQYWYSKDIEPEPVKRNSRISKFTFFELATLDSADKFQKQGSSDLFPSTGKYLLWHVNFRFKLHFSSSYS